MEIASAEIPALGDGEVLVRTSFSGISSGTELLAYRGELDPELPVDETIGALGGTFRFPFRYGYSCVGVVEESRSALEPGALVFAFHPHQDRFVADADDVVALGSVSAREATLFPLVETALQISLDAGPVLGDTVVVFGLGGVGHADGAHGAAGRGRVVAVEPRPWRRDAATADSSPSQPSAPDDAAADGQTEGSTDGRTARPARDRSVRQPTGAAGLPSRCWPTRERSSSLPGTGRRRSRCRSVQEFHRRRLTIRSTQVSTIPARLSDRWNPTRRRRAVVTLLDELPLAALATHTFPFDAAGDGFAAIDAGTAGLIHAAFGYD